MNLGKRDRQTLNEVFQDAIQNVDGLWDAYRDPYPDIQFKGKSELRKGREMADRRLARYKKLRDKIFKKEC